MASSLSSTLSTPRARSLLLPSGIRGSAMPTSTISFNRSPQRPGSTLAAAAAAAPGKRYKGTAKREEMLAELIEKKVAEAMEACGDEEKKESEGCRVAWDEVEEVSQAKADLRRRLAESGGADPLESFCEGNPDSDECLVYDD